MMIKLGSVTVETFDDYTVTRFADGLEVHAHHAEQPGQADTAARLGYAEAFAMNKEHDLAHALLAYWLGLPHSPTLRDVAEGKPANDLHYLEEEAVMALCRFSNAVGVSLLDVARDISRRPV